MRALAGLSFFEVLAYTGIYAFACWGPQRGPLSAWTGLATFLIAAYPVGSNLIRGKSLSEMGLDPRQLRPAARLAAAWGAPACLALLLLGGRNSFRLYGGRISVSIGSWAAPLPSVWILPVLYVLFALVQQYALLGFLFDRLRSAFGGDEVRAAVCGVLLFSLSHLPNPVLTLTGLLGGALFFGIFLKRRNLLPIVVLHALLGLLTFRAFADRTAFAVGRRYSDWRQGSTP